MLVKCQKYITSKQNVDLTEKKMGLQSSHSERLSQTHFAMGTSNTLGEKVGLDLIRKHEMHCVTNDWIRNTNFQSRGGAAPWCLRNSVWCEQVCVIYNRPMVGDQQPSYLIHVIYCWLVVWNIFIFPYIGNNHPNWLIFFRGVAQPPTSDTCDILWKWSYSLFCHGSPRLGAIT